MSQRRALISLLILTAACGQDTSGPVDRPDPVASVLVSPATATVMVGVTTQLSVSLKNSASAILTGRPVAWQSSNGNIATVSAAGLVTAKAAGPVVITATSEGQSGTASLTVIPVPVASVTVVPADAALGVGTSSQLSSITRDSAGNVLTGRTVTWASSDTTAVLVSATGLITAAGTGSSTITATSEGHSGTATITVDPTPVASVSVSPSTAQVGVAATTQLDATTRDLANHVLTGRVVAWFSSAPGVAQVDPNGVITGVSIGQATITAISEGKTGSAIITVVAGAPASITISPSPVSIIDGETVQLTALVQDAAGNPLAETVAWASLTPAVATVNGTGLVSSVSVGTALITATSGTLIATDTVTVGEAPVETVEIEASSTHLGIGSTIQLFATPKAANGSVLPGRHISWTSSDDAAATVSGTGLVTGVAVGTVTITATSEGKTATTILVIELEAVAAVIVSPASQSIGAGLDVQMSAVTLSAGGDTLTGRAIFWSSSTPSVATIDPDGLVAGVSAGTTTITATSEGVDGTANVTVVVTLAFPALDGGYAHTCSLTEDGDAYCWGRNSAGELGTGVITPNSAVPILVTGGVSFASLYPGGEHTCALTALNKAYCWGSNVDGQLGQGNNSSSAAPLAVAGGLQFSALTGGFAHVCGLAGAGKAYCWGSNGMGQLGDGTTTGRNAPVAVGGGKNYVELSARGSHTCGLLASGEAWCWGRNTDGELGDGTTANRANPVAVGGGLVFIELTTGFAHTCGLTAAGEAYCWGDNSLGQIGDGTTVDRLTPVAVAGGHTFQALKARGAHTCAVTTAGPAYCWGENSGGQLGDGSTTDRSSPVAVLGGLSFTEVSSGATFSCGVTDATLLYCWGDNSNGQLGDGSFVSSAVPVKVLGQP